MGAPRALALCHNFGGALQFQTGQWDQAEDSLRDAVDLYRQVGSASGEALSLQRLGVLLTAQGKLAEAYQCLGDGLVVAERAAMRSHCLTRLHASILRNRLAARDLRGLERSLAEGLEAARRHGKCVTCNALLMPEVIRAQIDLGDLDAAGASLDRLQRTAREFDSRAWTAMAEQASGRLNWARGDLDAAAACFERARQSFVAARQPYEAARCVAALARLTSDDEQRSALTEQARAIFTQLGASGVEDQSAIR